MKSRKQSAVAAGSTFKKEVWKYWREKGRHDLPWRKTHDPYKILVSEVMLQQTQVERVLPFYAEFTRRFPTAKKLARAPLAEVLQVWQGLGYNRRAKMLQAAAYELASTRFDLKNLASRSNLEEALEELPGVGPYTARAIAAFAYNQDVVFVETNIRTAILHHFFPRKEKVSDAQIIKILEQVLPKGKSRDWYAALMDYGAYLKKSGIKVNAKSSHYVKQSRFAGSSREARGAILRELNRGAAAAPRLLSLLGDDRTAQMRTALAVLLAEGLIQKRGSRLQLPH